MDGTSILNFAFGTCECDLLRFQLENNQIVTSNANVGHSGILRYIQ
jgi:hypothetical protein